MVIRVAMMDGTGDTKLLENMRRKRIRTDAFVKANPTL
jgi:hypothetical protein